MELKDILSGTKYNERFRSEDKIDKAFLEEVELQYLFQDGDNYNFMDNSSYEQISLSKDMVAETHQPFLIEEMVCRGQSYEGSVIFINLPNILEGEIDSTDASIKGQTVTSSYKPAILTNGAKIMVPPFIEIGNKIVIKSEDLSYVERVK